MVSEICFYMEIGLLVDVDAVCINYSDVRIWQIFCRFHCNTAKPSSSDIECAPVFFDFNASLPFALHDSLVDYVEFDFWQNPALKSDSTCAAYGNKKPLQ